MRCRQQRLLRVLQLQVVLTATRRRRAVLRLTLRRRLLALQRLGAAAATHQPLSLQHLHYALQRVRAAARPSAQPALQQEQQGPPLQLRASPRVLPSLARQGRPVSLQARQAWVQLGQGEATAAWALRAQPQLPLAQAQPVLRGQPRLAGQQRMQLRATLWHRWPPVQLAASLQLRQQEVLPVLPQLPAQGQQSEKSLVLRQLQMLLQSLPVPLASPRRHL